MQQVIEDTLTMEKKKSLAKQCIDKGYSVEWAHETNRLRVYVASELRGDGWTDEISAHVMLSREPSLENLDGGRIKCLVINTNPHSSQWKPVFSYFGGEGMDELSYNPQARELYDDVRRIFA